jgi:hypothetical protein
MTAAQAGWPTRPKARKNCFQNKIGILEIAKALGICTRRFMNNIEKYNMPCHEIHPMQDYL